MCVGGKAMGELRILWRQKQKQKWNHNNAQATLLPAKEKKSVYNVYYEQSFNSLNYDLKVNYMMNVIRRVIGSLTSRRRLIYIIDINGWGGGNNLCMLNK